MNNIEPTLWEDITADWDSLFMPIGFKQNIEQRIIRPVLNRDQPLDYSFILFGPPGTGKTTITHGIAKKIGWDVVYLGPQHFVGDKEDTIEVSIKKCFQSIEKFVEDYKKKTDLKKTPTRKIPLNRSIVFVFDEIDELVVTRDSGTDRQTRFGTTMMLPLINDLRKLAKKYGFIFFVLTNHIERFDPAIKRTGRFDLILPVGPPDRPQRYLLFENCLKKLDEKYHKKWNLRVRYEFEDEDGKLQKSADLDVISRASERLGVGDIESICERVVEQQIGMQPSIKEADPDPKKPSSYLNLETPYFIEWINKYRNSNKDTQDEIERFYKEYAIYSRGSTPYAQLNNIQEKVENEFGSLNVKHNLNNYGDEWKKNKAYELEYSLRNLTEISTFYGKIIVEYSLNKDKKYSQNVLVAAGETSKTFKLKITPKKTGKFIISFKIVGIFDIRGIDYLSDDNSALLNGQITITKEITVK